MRQNRLISFLSHELGADEGTWTHMKLPSLEPESSASASSATSAYMWTRVTSWSRLFCFLFSFLLEGETCNSESGAFFYLLVMFPEVSLPESSASASSATSAYMWTWVAPWSRFFCCSFPNQHVRFYHETFFLSTCFWKKFTVFLRVAEMARTAVKPLRSAAARFRAFRL